jgi:trans-aconitate methyltransferase
VKRTAPAALVNREPIARALARALPAAGRVVELGSGTGEHAVLLAARFPGLTWQPSDPDAEARASIAAWSAEARLPNLLPPLDWDVRLGGWRARPADAVLCLNVLHAAPPECEGALLDGAAEILPPRGLLAVYGPFTRSGARAAGRLARLDAKLRAHDPALGVRDLEALTAAAARRGLAREEVLPMAEEGDLLVLFRKADDDAR